MCFLMTVCPEDHENEVSKVQKTPESHHAVKNGEKNVDINFLKKVKKSKK